MDWKLEVVIAPVSDVERAREFYVDKLGFTLDTDHRGGEQSGNGRELSDSGAHA